MHYSIYDSSGTHINTIVASEMFVQNYCAKNGYTYEFVAPKPEPDPEPTMDERVTALEAENKTLKSKLTAAIESNSMLEECLVEMAGVVYA